MADILPVPNPNPISGTLVGVCTQLGAGCERLEGSRRVARQRQERPGHTRIERQTQGAPPTASAGRDTLNPAPPPPPPKRSLGIKRPQPN
jgi:hypothetical protein